MGDRTHQLRTWCASATTLRRFHGWATIVWFAVSYPLAIRWGSSVVFVTFLSLYAIVTGHWSSWQAARVEVRQDEIEAADGATS